MPAILLLNMHSFLLVGNDEDRVEKEIKLLVKKLKVSSIEFPVKKITDIHELSSFTKFKITQPTAFILKNIQLATNEALNAFLKNLEEPQENVYYILSTPSEHKVLPTIKSRCSVIKITNSKAKMADQEALEKFLKSPSDQKLLFLSSIKTKEAAISFLENLIAFLHKKLTSGSTNYKLTTKNLSAAQNSLDSLYKNGNVALQLTAFVVNLDWF